MNLIEALGEGEAMDAGTMTIPTHEGTTEATPEQGAATGPKPPWKEKTHTRAGFTTHKGQGQSKARRKMVKESRRRNRRKGGAG